MVQRDRPDPGGLANAPAGRGVDLKAEDHAATGSVTPPIPVRKRVRARAGLAGTAIIAYSAAASGSSVSVIGTGSGLTVTGRGSLLSTRRFLGKVLGKSPTRADT
jgi:hypothetical protein